MITNTAAVVSGVTKPTSEKSSHLLRARRNWTVALCISGCLGIATGLIGIILSFESLAGIGGVGVSRLGAIMIAVMFPLLMLTAHCLDKVGEAEKAIRLEYCRNNGMQDLDC